MVIVGEAILLLIGKYFSGKKDDDWKTRFNLNTLLIDMAFGAIIIFNAFEDMPLIILALLALSITHLYREIEYFKKEKKNRFITNRALWVVNSIKLIGLIGLFFLAV
jgi:hypothetical protein